jgi:hypothetical protein
MTNSQTFRTTVPGTYGAQIGYIFGDENTSAVVTDCYFYGARTALWFYDGITFRRCVVDNDAQLIMEYALKAGQNLTGWDVDENTYVQSGAQGGDAFVADGVNKTFAEWKTDTGFDAASTFGTAQPDAVVVRPNAFEPGRGHVVVYNWSGASEVAVDMSSILAVGQQYEIREVQRYYNDPPALQGTYAGGTLNLPMAAVTPPTPVSGHKGGAPSPPPSTGTDFHTFIVHQPGER